MHRAKKYNFLLWTVAQWLNDCRFPLKSSLLVCKKRKDCTTNVSVWSESRIVPRIQCIWGLTCLLLARTIRLGQHSVGLDMFSLGLLSSVLCHFLVSVCSVTLAQLGISRILCPNLYYQWVTNIYLNSVRYYMLFFLVVKILYWMFPIKVRCYSSKATFSHFSP